MMYPIHISMILLFIDLFIVSLVLPYFGALKDLIRDSQKSAIV